MKGVCMGGALLSIKAKTQEKLNKQVEKAIQKADRMGLMDVRSIKVFAPGEYIKPDDQPEDQWVAVVWVHS